MYLSSYCFTLLFPCGGKICGSQLNGSNPEKHPKKPMIQDTSLWAHELAKQKLGEKQKAVLDALRFFPDATNAEIAAHMGWPINRITPRMGELRKMGLVLEAGRRTC